MLENEVSPISKPKTIYLKDYRPPDFLISTVFLDFVLDGELATVKAKLEVTRNGQHTRPLILDGEKQTLLAVSVDGTSLAPSEYQVNDDSLSLDNLPDAFILDIETQCKPLLNTELSGLYQSSGNYCTQCEAEGFRRITYFLDRPDVLAIYDVRITASKDLCPVLLSNGNLSEKGTNDDGTHWAIWSDPHPKPCYLFALVAGDLESISDSFTTASGRQVELNIFTQAHNITKCQHAMDSLKSSMHWDECVYGREYDLDVYNIVAVDDFNMGAMENKGLNVFNSKYVLANQQTATDSDYEGIESVIGHEYFHNWSGNRVTCRDWFQLSLKEGFTVFRDQEFSADQGSRAVKRIRDVQVLRAHQFKEDAGPMAHPVRPDSYQEINNFYTVTIYEKGAEVIRMLHSILGAEGFRKGTDLYFDTYDGQAVTTEDFICSLETANDIELKQFRRWYTQAGTPAVTVSQSYSAGVLTLSMQQSCQETPGQTNKLPFHIPISMALFSGAGEQQRSSTLELVEENQTFIFDGLTEQPLVSLLRGFSAPIKLNFAQSNRDLELLIAYEDNGFAAWEAMQRLCLNALLPAIESQSLNDKDYLRLRSIFTKLVGSEHVDLAIFSEMLSLPSASYMAELSSPIEPQKIVALRDLVTARLANELADEFEGLYLSNKADSFSLSADAMAQRALKNKTLSYLVATERVDFCQLAIDQYYSADNMTDRLAAFAAILNSNSDKKESLVKDFYRTWHDDSLVMDKWFAIQAGASDENVLDRVQELMEHPGFSLNNPNKVRALIGAYAGNLKGFHRADGRGYEFLADQIIALNELNPQIAARLAGVFNSWKNYAEPYSTMMGCQLKRISEQSDLSKDVSEIVGKALNIS